MKPDTQIKDVKSLLHGKKIDTLARGKIWFDIHASYDYGLESAIVQKIVDAARRCLFNYGPSKMSMQDVARKGKVSRASIYNYFEDREELIAYVVQMGAQAWAHDVDAAMAQEKIFEDQMIAGAWVARIWHQMEEKAPLLDREYEQRFLDDPAVSHFPTEIGTFVPYVRRAQERGEIRPELNSMRTAEWVVRIVRSLARTPGHTLNIDNFAEFQSFIRDHLIAGLR